MGREGRRAKTKTVLKPVKQWEQLGSMPNWKFRNFLNKNPPSKIGTIYSVQCNNHKLLETSLEIETK